MCGLLINYNLEAVVHWFAVVVCPECYLYVFDVVVSHVRIAVGGGSECRPLMSRYPSEDECKWSSYYNLTADYWPLNKVYALSLRLWLFLTECPINPWTVFHESQIVCMYMYIYQNNWKLMIYYTSQ